MVVYLGWARVAAGRPVCAAVHTPDVAVSARPGGRPDRRPRGCPEGPVTAPGPIEWTANSSPSANHAHFFVSTLEFRPTLQRRTR